MILKIWFLVNCLMGKFINSFSSEVFFFILLQCFIYLLGCVVTLNCNLLYYNNQGLKHLRIDPI